MTSSMETLKKGLLENKVSEGFLHAIIWPTLIGLLITTILFSMLFSSNSNVERFLTFRGTTSWVRIGVSHFATALGGWALFLGPSYGFRFGILSFFVYPFNFLLVYLIIAYAAPRMLAQMERAKVGSTFYSLADYASFRYGRWFSLWLASLTVFYGFVLMIGEFSNIGGVTRLGLNGDFAFTPLDNPEVTPEAYSYFVLWPILLVAIVTATYTILAGLPASIWSDLVQGVLVVFFVTGIVIACLVVLFRGTDTGPFVDLKSFQMRYCLISVTLPVVPSMAMNLGIWQRVLVTTNKSQQRKAMALGLTLLTPMFIILGLLGWGFNAKYKIATLEYDLLKFHPSGWNALGATILSDLPRGVFALFYIVILLLSASTIDSAQTGVISVFAGRLLGNSTSERLKEQDKVPVFGTNRSSDNETEGFGEDDSEDAQSKAAEPESSVNKRSLLYSALLVILVTSAAVFVGSYMAIDNTGPLALAIIGIYTIGNIFQMAAGVPLFMGLSSQTTPTGAISGTITASLFPFFWGIYYDGYFSSGFRAYIGRSIHLDPVTTRLDVCAFDGAENLKVFLNGEKERNGYLFSGTFGKDSLLQTFSHADLLHFLPKSCRDPGYCQFLTENAWYFQDEKLGQYTSINFGGVISAAGSPVAIHYPDPSTDIWNGKLYFGVLITAFVVTYFVSLLTPSQKLTFF